MMIYFSFFPLAQLDHPQTIESRPPCAPHLSNLLAYASFVARACFWLVFVFDFPVGSHLRPRPILFSIFYSAAQYEDTTPPHTFRPGHVSSLTPLPPSTPNFGWLLCPPIKRQPSKSKGPPISQLIFVDQFDDQSNNTASPHTFHPGRASSPTPPPLPTPTFI
jgi:hypothetical protein